MGRIAEYEQIKDYKYDLNLKLCNQMIFRRTKDEEVENKDYSQIIYAKTNYMGNKEDLVDLYQSFEIMIDGYNEEKRELY